MIPLPNWDDPAYLLRGTSRQQAAYHALQSLGVFHVMRAYSPLLVGTIPLDIDLPDSDLDIICEISEVDSFAAAVSAHFGPMADFSLRRGRHNDLPTVVVSMQHAGFEVEIFGQPRPVHDQHAYRHMVVEARLLAIGGAAARVAIRRLKASGLKTEPAFAQYFGLTGDPYARLLAMYTWDTAALRDAVDLPE